MWFSPKSERLYGGINLVKKRAVVLGGTLFTSFISKFWLSFSLKNKGSFAMWGGLFSLTDCFLIHVR
jgi:import inner membrane translocase subunit TIM17